MADVGLTHVALAVTDSDASADFYGRFAELSVVHRRPTDDPSLSGEVLWLSDGSRPFVVVLVPQPTVHHVLKGPLNHLGVGVAAPSVVDERVRMAIGEGRTATQPKQDPPPVGYWAVIQDPDGHTLELSYGQQVSVATNPI